MNNAEDILKKILLNMRYDASKTLKENREIIFEDSNKSWVDVNNNPISFNGTVLKTAKTQLKDFETAELYEHCSKIYDAIKKLKIGKVIHDVQIHKKSDKKNI